MALKLVSLLTQRLGQALLQFVRRLAADILADLGALLRQRWPFLQKLLPSGLGVKGLDLAQLIDREIAGVESGRLVDHRIEKRLVDIPNGRRRRAVVALDLRPILHQRWLQA